MAVKEKKRKKLRNLFALPFFFLLLSDEPIVRACVEEQTNRHITQRPPPSCLPVPGINQKMCCSSLVFVSKKKNFLFS
ncbi:Uncharacterized protein APZ42_003029, partial [Daphnia magna]